MIFNGALQRFYGIRHASYPDNTKLLVPHLTPRGPAVIQSHGQVSHHNLPSLSVNYKHRNSCGASAAIASIADIEKVGVPPTLINHYTIILRS